jgi:hypothetical protein
MLQEKVFDYKMAIMDADGIADDSGKRKGEEN